MLDIIAKDLDFSYHFKRQNTFNKRWPNGAFSGTYWDVNNGDAVIAMGNHVASLFPSIFEKTDISLGIIIFLFIALLTSNLLSYLFAYQIELRL